MTKLSPRLDEWGLPLSEQDGDDPYVTVRAERVKRSFGYETAADSVWLASEYVRLSQVKETIKKLRAQHGPVRITVLDKEGKRIKV